jgi:anti-sigma regulatory factor (Ser/Thr protein kinase)
MSEAPGHFKSGNARWELACELESVRAISSAVHDFLLAQGCEPGEARDCELALVEACNNAIQYIHPSKRSCPVIVEARCKKAHVELRVVDQTPGFDWPRQFALPSPESEHGRGLYLIHSLMDSTEYLRTPLGNTLVLRKQRSI